MRILFYAGYQRVPLNQTINTGGGTEIALVSIAEEMVKFGYEVIISGEVEKLGKINGVTWMPTHEIHQTYDYFDVIISASYIHFLLEFKNYTSAKKIFWAHNTHHHAWYNGFELTTGDELVKEVDSTVCLTNWHADIWAERYNVDRDSIEIIGNGINTSTFIGTPSKIKNKFIWSSEPERGLMSLLHNWPKIKMISNTASLDIYSPEYGLDQLEHMMPIINMLEDVNVIGNKSQSELHDAMLRAEYWCYVTDYEETYCITALEMQYAKVIPIATKTAALNETIKSGIICDSTNETNWNSAILSIGGAGSQIKEKVIESNYNWAKCQTWNQRSYDWKNLIEKLTHE